MLKGLDVLDKDAQLRCEYVPAKSPQSCPTLCDSTGWSLPHFSVHGILQERTLKWVAMPSSRGLFLIQGSNLSLMSPALAGGFFTTSATWEAPRGKLKGCQESRRNPRERLGPGATGLQWLRSASQPCNPLQVGRAVGKFRKLTVLPFSHLAWTMSAYVPEKQWD